MGQVSNPVQHCRQSSDSSTTYRWIGFVVLAAIAVRAVNLGQPLVGNFATKQAVYAMAARNWALDRAPLWQPTIDCLTVDGERAWHLMEWPATAYATAVIWKCCGGSLDVIGRLVGIACSVAATLLAYLLARRWFGEAAARATALTIGFAPLMIAYGRGFLLEPSLVTFSLASVYGLDTWLRNRRVGWLLLAAVATSLAVATKIYMLLLVLPLTGFVWSARIDRRRAFVLLLAFAAALTPTAAWYAWVAGVSTDVGPAVEFHPFTRAEVHAWPHPLLTEPLFYRHVFRDLVTIGLTPLGVALVIAGMTDARFRAYLPWLSASFGLIVALPLKFAAAHYYYLILLPPAALAVGVGWQRCVERFRPNTRVTTAVVAVAMLISARYAVGPGYRIPDDDRSVTTAAAAVRELTAEDEAVATLHGSTIDLLYYCDRPGWALNGDDARLTERLDELAEQGVAYLAIVDAAPTDRNASFTAWRRSQSIAAAGDGWAIVRLGRAPQIADAAPATGREFPPRPAPRIAAQ